MIKVLVVEDSPVVQQMIAHILKSDPEIEVIGLLKNGKEAVNFVKHTKPDVITMDVNMPVLNGLDATKIIMNMNPVPIVIVSSNFNPKDINHTFMALQAGAVAVAEKPARIGTEEFKIASKKLIQTVKLMSEIKVISRKFSGISSNETDNKENVLFNYFTNEKKNYEVIGIGASTGGPQVIEKILSSLPTDYSLPFLIVQHISPGFTSGFVDWLNTNSKLKVSVAKDGEHIEPGNCYIAPDNFHLTVTENKIIKLTDDEPENNLRPSIDRLFSSLANYYNKSAIGILLTGMGKDGAKELKTMKDLGCLTIAQSKESSLIFGMPAEAVKLDAANLSLSPDEIIKLLISIHKQSKNVI